MGVESRTGYVTVGCQLKKSVSGTDSGVTPDEKGGLRSGLGSAPSWRHAARVPLEEAVAGSSDKAVL